MRFRAFQASTGALSGAMFTPLFCVDWTIPMAMLLVNGGVWYFMSTDVIMTLLLLLDWILKTAHALPVPDSQTSDFMLERTAVPRFHDIEMSFRTGIKISLRYSYLGVLALIWLALVWDFLLISCKRTQNHNIKMEWTRTGMKATPVSYKHPLSSINNLPQESTTPWAPLKNRVQQGN